MSAPAIAPDARPSRFAAGDLVAVVTLDRGERGWRKRSTEVWMARLVGPSPIGGGWWLVRKVDVTSGVEKRRNGRGGATFTVPESEMSRP